MGKKLQIIIFVAYIFLIDICVGTGCSHKQMNASTEKNAEREEDTSKAVSTPIEEKTNYVDNEYENNTGFDFCGEWTESGSGRVNISITQDESESTPYIVEITGSSGASFLSTASAIGKWNGQGIEYTGIIKNEEYGEGGIVKSESSGTSGLIYLGEDGLVYLDEYDQAGVRGPFERVEYSNEYNVYNEPSEDSEDYTASYDDGRGFYGTWTGNGVEDTFTGGSFNGKIITISPSNKEGYEYRVVISDPYDNGMLGSSIRAFGNYDKEYGIVYSGGEYDNIDFAVNWPAEAKGVLYLDDDNSLYNYDASTENTTGPFKKTSDKSD
ncbi:MAG: hypothetical protein HFH59_17050 [Lachnospiraceae bacterium]|nr:hypothetical protein [Lachnospiraceae bacterium]